MFHKTKIFMITKEPPRFGFQSTSTTTATEVFSAEKEQPSELGQESRCHIGAAAPLVQSAAREPSKGTKLIGDTVEAEEAIPQLD